MRYRTGFALVVGLTVGVSAPGTAQPAGSAQRVELTTADGVELVARYHPGPRGTKSPTAIVLDGIGENRRPKVCDAIASELQKQGCATICFDFRGHGESTAVGTQFWDDPTNRKLVRGFKGTAGPERIDFADFRPGYFRTLVNDVAAVRAFLERRNDAGECNTGNLMVVGLREGASLGALWVASEWSRYRVTGGFNARLAPSPEGRDILGCIWIQPELNYDRQRIPLLDCVKRAATKRTAFVSLFHADGDGPLTRFAQQCAAALNKGNSRLFQAAALETARGEDVQDHAGLNAKVAAVAEQMLKAQDPPPWDDRDFTTKRYVWAVPGGGILPAKDEDERTFKPVPIDRLIPR
jgi:pimeloyl-ACP methyl ester carboxylesterase